MSEREGHLEALLKWLLERMRGRPAIGDVPPPLETYVPRVADALGDWSRPFDAAVVVGLEAECVAHAFAAGYQCALRALLPGLRADETVALCVTEAGGGHPAAVQTRLTADGGRYRVNGSKRWATMGTAAERLLVAASEGVGEDGRNRLRLVLIDAREPGVTLEAMPPTPFAPEIAHAAVRLEDVAVSAAAVLPDDGYTAYIKPFRTVEDIHVQAALLGHLLRVAAAFDWPRPVRGRLFAPLLALRAIDEGPRDAPGVHVALGGVLDGLSRLLAELEPYWTEVAEPVRARWRRDQGLLGVAETARRKRLERAWERVG